jgi:hypothetical protein
MSTRGRRPRHRTDLLRVLLLVTGAISTSPQVAMAQILSPGKLAAAHTELEGLRQCTSCHQLGTRGISAARCLDCHEALATRITADQGYHATVEPDSCADCHQDHLGEDFGLIRLDEESFDHDATGYMLALSHEATTCRSCHVPAHVADPAVRAFKADRNALDKTFLGLSSTCATCHDDESPHGEQFGGQECATCHDEGTWEEATNFDHGGTAFALDGSHLEVGCVDCHDSGDVAVYRPLAFGSCADCHTDPHAGVMPQNCASCHQTGGWDLLALGAMDESFDHSRTAFPLRGAHSASDCASCHRPGRPPRTELIYMTYRAGTANLSYPRPLSENCASCHVDRHAFPDTAGRWTDCAGCHAEAVWAPSDFGATRHGEESEFTLTGAHAATPCFACHQDADAGQDRFTLSIDGRACVDCHAVDDPHGDLYPDLQCEACHVTEAFDVAGFDHAAVEQSGPDGGCASCHATDDPHADQFEGQDCASCHETESFTATSFDHGSSRFPLDGAHENAECAACHVEESQNSERFVRYRPLAFECTDCHVGDR